MKNPVAKNTFKFNKPKVIESKKSKKLDKIYRKEMDY